MYIYIYTPARALIIYNFLTFFRFRVQIFYSNFFHPAKSTKLSRHERTLIFNHKDFDASFEAYKNGSSKMPSSKVYLGFGRQWYFSEETRLPITAIVKSRRHQNLCDSVGVVVIGVQKY